MSRRIEDGVPASIPEARQHLRTRRRRINDGVLPDIPRYITVRELEAAVSIRCPPYRPRRKENEEDEKMEDGELPNVRRDSTHKGEHEKDVSWRPPKHSQSYSSSKRTGSSGLDQASSPAADDQVSMLRRKHQSQSLADPGTSPSVQPLFTSRYTGRGSPAYSRAINSQATETSTPVLD